VTFEDGLQAHVIIPLISAVFGLLIGWRRGHPLGWALLGFFGKPLGLLIALSLRPLTKSGGLLDRFTSRRFERSSNDSDSDADVFGPIEGIPPAVHARSAALMDALGGRAKRRGRRDYNGAREESS